MGVRFPGAGVNTQPGVLGTLAAETVVATSLPLTPSQDNAQVFIFAYCPFQAGSSGQTTGTCRIRRGTTTAGVLLGAPQAITLPATETGLFTLIAVDVPGAVSNQQYVLTAQQAGGSGTNPAINDATIIAFAL